MSQLRITCRISPGHCFTDTTVEETDMNISVVL
jgi:hypothetical protein